MRPLRLHFSILFWNCDTFIVQKVVFGLSGLSRQEVFISMALLSASSKSILSCLLTSRSSTFQGVYHLLLFCFCLFLILLTKNVAKTFIVIVIHPYYFELINDLNIRSEWVDYESLKGTILDLQLNWIDGRDGTMHCHIQLTEAVILLTSFAYVVHVSQFTNRNALFTFYISLTFNLMFPFYSKINSI